MIYLFVITLLLVIINITQYYLNNKERSKLLDRIMSKNYNDYKIHETNIPPDIDPQQPLSDTEEYELEEQRRISKLIEKE